MKPRRTASITHNCRYHVIFCTKYRRPVLVDGAEARFKELARETIEELGVEMLGVDVQPDKVELVLAVNPRLSIHTVVKRIKARTSPVLREEFAWVKSRVPSLWTNSYFVSTVGPEQPKVIKSYLESQKNM